MHFVKFNCERQSSTALGQTVFFMWYMRKQLQLVKDIC